MKCLDLFSGIGGMGRLLPFEPVMFCEWDEFPRSVLERRIKSGDLPDVPIHEDVRTLDPPDHDILIGGFPCQDISTLGLKKGLKGDKSSLYYQILRIVKIKHPKYVFLENVAHILQMPEVWQVVLTTLRIYWKQLNSMPLALYLQLFLFQIIFPWISSPVLINRFWLKPHC